MDNNIAQTLQSIGLNDREAKVYLATLELGESTVLPISKKSGIKRTYCYDILSHLIDKNLVSYYEKNHRRRYLTQDPEKITKTLENRVESFNSILPDLKLIFNRSATKPKIRFFEGVEGVKDIYRELLKVDEVLAIASPKHIEANLGDFFEQFSSKMIEKKVIARELITKDGASARYIQKFDNQFEQARFLPDDVQIKTDMIFYGDKLAMISYGSDIHAVVIESSSIVETQKMMFEIIWQNAERIGKI